MSILDLMGRVNGHAVWVRWVALGFAAAGGWYTVKADIDSIHDHIGQVERHLDAVDSRVTALEHTTWAMQGRERARPPY